MEWLPKEDYLDVGESLAEGHQTRINHNAIDCSGNSASLKIERQQNGDISAYCFRCGRRGFHRAAPSLASLKARISNEGHTEDTDGTIREPQNLVRAFQRWPVEARVWINRARVTEEEVEHYGLAYEPNTGRVIIPWYDGDGNLVQYQSRRVSDADPKPKYLTYRKDNDVPAVLLTDNCICDSTRLIIVEDFLSGVRVGRFVPTLVLMGTKLQGYHLREIVYRGYDEFVIWLDDDNVQVKKAQLQIKKSLDKVGKALIYHGNGVDPKELSDDGILEILSEVKM